MMKQATLAAFGRATCKAVKRRRGLNCWGKMNRLSARHVLLRSIVAGACEAAPLFERRLLQSYLLSSVHALNPVSVSGVTTSRKYDVHHWDLGAV